MKSSRGGREREREKDRDSWCMDKERISQGDERSYYVRQLRIYLGNSDRGRDRVAVEAV